MFLYFYEFEKKCQMISEIYETQNMLSIYQSFINYPNTSRQIALPILHFAVVITFTLLRIYKVSVKNSKTFIANAFFWIFIYTKHITRSLSFKYIYVYKYIYIKEASKIKRAPK